jgi:hypothetical protein
MEGFLRLMASEIYRDNHLQAIVVWNAEGDSAMTITVDLTEDQARAFLKFLRELPRQDQIVEDASERVRVAIGKALADS